MTSNAPMTPQQSTVATVTEEEPTIGRLVADASRDISSLIQNEIALAKSELKVSVEFGGTGAGLFAAAAFVGVLAIIMVSVAFAYFLHMTGLDLAWCFLIVFGAYLLIAALLGFLGMKKVKQVRAPERAIHQAQETKTLSSGSSPRGGSTTRHGRCDRDPGPLAAQVRRCQRGPVPRRRGAVPDHAPRDAAGDSPWCSCCTVSPSSGGPGATRSAPRRARLPGCRDGPARVRRLGQASARLRPADPVPDVAGVVKALGERSAVLVGQGWGGYVAWAAAALHPREVSALCAVAAPHPSMLPLMLADVRSRSAACWATCSRCRRRPCRSAGSPAPTSSYVRSHLRAWSSPDPPSPTRRPWRRTTRRSACGPRRTVRWSTTAGCSAHASAATAGSSTGTCNAAVAQPVCVVNGADDPALPRGGADRSQRQVTRPSRPTPSPASATSARGGPGAFDDVLLRWLAATGRD